MMKLDSLDNYRRDDYPIENTIWDSVNFFGSKVLVVGKPKFVEKILSRTKEVTATENFEWKFKDKQFDVVLVYLTFTEKNLTKTLWRIYNSMRSKGKLVILNMSENPFVKLAKELGSETDMPTEDALKDALYEVGFKITRLEKLRQFYDFPSVAEAMLAIRTNGIFGKHVPDEKMELVRYLFEKQLHFPSENHLIIAEKMTFE